MEPNIWVAAADDRVDLVEKYLNSNEFTANAKDPNGYTPIHAAASYGHIDLLKLLISRGGNINIQDNDGDTPLHHVEDIETAKFIVEQLKGDYNIRNEENQTAADYIEEGAEQPEITQYLRSLLHDKPETTGTVFDSLPSSGVVDGHAIRYTMEEDAGDLDPERRRKLEEIANSENPEEALRELVTSAVRDGLSQFKREEEGGDSKRSRAD
ncbi:ankyrin [Metschnikowia bicuspidata var. bicuspidata NRRL YB-4993]|uniref:Ankyrin n=1 Tax=Metschnikowia bicuspidata var. bicuspidata NRRL YB-4993 TaxID=869754 RepID=A0A1A0H859_9ASCO|nr:ankyrin [Metschnikowia bicuspidata var. bicuspidata NRRL YB-4993]OBA20077.1 ankyrin [Metschnikowia bicuspidata var. bicuspidata NRRL YB-4993]